MVASAASTGVALAGFLGFRGEQVSHLYVPLGVVVDSK